jgi:hypothetical protein
MSDNEGDGAQQQVRRKLCPKLSLDPPANIAHSSHNHITHALFAGAAANRRRRSGQQISRLAEQVVNTFYRFFVAFMLQRDV